MENRDVHKNHHGTKPIWTFYGEGPSIDLAASQSALALAFLFLQNFAKLYFLIDLFYMTTFRAPWGDVKMASSRFLGGFLPPGGFSNSQNNHHGRPSWRRGSEWISTKSISSWPSKPSGDRCVLRLGSSSSFGSIPKGREKLRTNVRFWRRVDMMSWSTSARSINWWCIVTCVNPYEKTRAFCKG